MESTSIKKGDLWTLVRISLPIFLFLFCEYSMVFGERILLSYYKKEALSASLNGTYLAFIFQSSCTAITSMALVFIGLHQGKGELKQIGPCIWQLIWFSFLSLVITLPLSFWSASLYFKGTPIEKMGIAYFNLLAWGNCLFPLNTALTSFYIGRGKTMLVTVLMTASYVFNFFLCWMLVFGVGNLIPSLGIRGAALAKCLSLGLACLILFCSFLRKKNRVLYGTGVWQLSVKALWSYIQPGMVRAFNYFWVRGSWVAISYLMINKGGAYLDVQAIGGTVISFLAFIVVGMYRSILAISPNLLGGKRYAEIENLFRSMMIYACMIGIVIAVPLLLYPKLLSLLFDASSRELFENTFNQINHWIWLHLFALSVQMGISGFIVAAQDLKTQFYSLLFITLASLLAVYLVMEVWNCQPDKLWLIMGLENALLALIFFCRFRQRKWEEKALPGLQA